MFKLAADPKRWMERDGAGVGFGTLESRLLDQKCRYDPVDDLQDRREQFGMCSEQKAKRDRKREHPGYRDVLVPAGTASSLRAAAARSGRAFPPAPAALLDPSSLMVLHFLKATGIDSSMGSPLRAITPIPHGRLRHRHAACAPHAIGPPRHRPLRRCARANREQTLRYPHK